MSAEHGAGAARTAEPPCWDPSGTGTYSSAHGTVIEMTSTVRGWSDVPFTGGGAHG